MTSSTTRTEKVKINGELIKQLIEPMLRSLGHIKNSEDLSDMKLPSVFNKVYEVEFTTRRGKEEVQTIVSYG